MIARRITPPTLALLALACGLAAHAQETQVPAFNFSDAFGAPTAPTEDPVTLEARYGANEQGGVLEITAKIAPGYHIYAITQPPGGPGAATISVAQTADFRLGADFTATPAPETHIDTEIWEGLRIEEHTGTVVWRAPLTIARGATPESMSVVGNVSLQACQEFTCEPLELAFTAGFDPALTPIANSQASQDLAPPVVADGGGDPPIADAPFDGSLVAILGAAMLGGLILNLMPCVLPVIGLKVLSFAEQAGHDRGRVFAMNLVYSIGLLSVFMLLAALAAFAGYGWGELYTHTEFKIGMVILVFAMGLSFLGVWEIPLPGFVGSGTSNELQEIEGLGGAFFKGVFTTILATPCSGPFVGPVIGYTLTQPPWMTFSIFGAVGLGMASPYLLIGIFPELAGWLPKPGMWMVTFKKLMGFVLMGTAVFLMWSVDESLYLPLLSTLVAVGFACWWVGSTPMTASGSRRGRAWLGGVGVAAATGWLAFTGAALLDSDDHKLPWQPYSDAALASALDRGETVLVEFTADWCLTCKVNLVRAIDTEETKRVVEANGVTPLLADWTDKNDDLKATLESLGSRSIPLVAIYPAGRSDDPIILRDLITQEQLLAALREAGATRENAGELSMPTIEIGEAANEGALR